MHVCYIYSTIPRKKHFLSKNTTKPAKPENSGIVVNQAAKAELFTRHYMPLHVIAFSISTVKMFSPIETLAAAGLFIVVFSQLISSTAGNSFFFFQCSL